MSDDQDKPAVSQRELDDKARAFWAEPIVPKQRAKPEPEPTPEPTAEPEPATGGSDEPNIPEANSVETNAPGTTSTDPLAHTELTPRERAAIQQGRTNPARRPYTASRPAKSTSASQSSTPVAAETVAKSAKRPKQKHPAEPNQKSERKTKSPKTRAGFGVFRGIRRTFYALASVIFLFAAGAVVFFGAEPWITAWLDDAAPDITLPSIQTLKNMSQRERDLLLDDAMRLARFRQTRVINETLPATIDSRPEEVGTYPLNGRHRRVKVAGIARRIKLADSREFIRLTDFEITPGYDLVLALSPDPDPRTGAELRASGYLEFAELKAEIGAQNYLLPTTFSIDEFDSLVIFDRIFGVVYAAARLR